MIYEQCVNVRDSNEQCASNSKRICVELAHKQMRLELLA